MTDQLFIKPADGCKVRDPGTGALLDAAGEAKPKTTFWLRRLRDGDVEVCEPAPVKAPKKDGKK